MKRFAKTIMFALILMLIPARIWAQNYQNAQIRDYENGFLFNVFSIENVEERVQLASALATSDIWLCNPTDNPGELFIRPNGYNADIPIYAEFDYLRMILREEYEQVSSLPKDEFAESFNSWVRNLSIDYFNFLISDQLDRANHCMDAEPFCTSDVYNFPAYNSGTSWSGPNYGCLNSSPTTKQSFWYYMRIGVAGNITIKIEAGFDVDFALWGPFTNQTDPCPTAAGQAGLLTAACSSCPNNTSNPNFYPSGNLHDCSFSAQSYEYAHVVNGQVGQYYILLITNYSGNTSGNITFQKYAGDGETDCGILPPLVANDGPYCAGQTIHLTANGQAGASYSWTGPGGWTSNQQNPTRTNCTVAMSGTYTCTITLGSQTNSATTQVVVNAQPTANAGPDQTIIYGATAQLSGSGGSGTFNYQWAPANMVVNPNAQNTQTVSLTSDQTYTLTVTNPQGGCTSTDQVTIHISGSNMVVTPGDDVSICQGGSSTIQANAGGGTGNFTYSWSPTTGLSNPNIFNPTASPTQTTTYTCTVSDGMSTQSVSVTVTVNDIVIEHEYASICPDETYSWHGVTYSDPGVYEYNTTTAQGCEETDYLHLDYYPTYDETPIYAAICSGETYYYNGNAYTETGQYPNTLQTIHGCDSIVRLNLTVWPDNGITPNDITVCPEQLPVNFYGVDYYEDGTDVLVWDTDIHGCDSAVRLTLHVRDYYQPPLETKYVGYYDTPSYNWYIPEAGTTITYTEGGTHTEILPTSACEGIFTLELHFGQIPYNPPIIDTACDSYDWWVGNVKVGTYTTSGTYSYSIPFCEEANNLNTQYMYYSPSNPSTPIPCTVDYTLNLTVNYSSNHEGDTLVNTECDTFIWHFGWNGETYTYNENTIVTKTIPTSHGCDSTVTLTIQNMMYTPHPVIRCSDWHIEFPDHPITATEFNVNRYTYHVEDAVSDISTWNISQCGWTISKDSWPIVISEDKLSCTVYAMDWVPDTIWLNFRAVNACSDTIVRYGLVPSFYGIEETDAYPAEVNVVPNPNNGQMELRFENMEGKINVRVSNASGTLIDSFEVHATQAPYTHSYAMKRLANGVYFFTFSNGKRNVTKKVVIIH